MIHVRGYQYRGGVQYCGGTQITKDDIPPRYSLYPPMYHESPHGTERTLYRVTLEPLVVHFKQIFRHLNLLSKSFDSSKSCCLTFFLKKLKSKLNRRFVSKFE